MARIGIKIREVETGSPAHRAGIAPGDEILTVNGRSIPDELALKFHLAEECVKVKVRKAGGAEQELEFELLDGLRLGIEVEEFRTRTCGNACLFCFVDQLPPDAKPAFRIKDDDYRLSFLHGNYITLTNLHDRDLDRMIEQKLSPLYVSVHATDIGLRTRILGRKRPDDLHRKMLKLIEGGVRLNTQIVLMPGINDGENLEKTVFDLRGLYPGVHSVAIVPLGLSGHGSARHRYTPVSASYCRSIVEQMRPWQEEFRRTIRRTFACLSDEFYIRARTPIPDLEYYDDLAQIEDGVGMVRQFLNDFGIEMANCPKRRVGLRGTLTTARLFHPYLQTCMKLFNEKFDSSLEVRKVENRFMGKEITVAGLLAGRDIIAALAGRDVGSFVIVPDAAVSAVDGLLVDNLALSDLSRRLGKPVYAGGRTVRDFFTLLCKELSERQAGADFGVSSPDRQEETGRNASSVGPSQAFHRSHDIQGR